jgi:hypothetical protein
MLSATYAVPQALYAECSYFECLYAEYRGAIFGNRYCDNLIGLFPAKDLQPSLIFCEYDQRLLSGALNSAPCQG